MSPHIDSYLEYVSTVRRYSPRTRELYGEVLAEFDSFAQSAGTKDITECLTPQLIRSYEVHLLDERQLDARTVSLHLSVLSGLSRYLVTRGVLSSNPVRLVTRPKVDRRLPQSYRDEAMTTYFASTEHSASHSELEILSTFGQDARESKTARGMYDRRLRRLIISILYGTGIRRAELISLTPQSVDGSRCTLRVRGKGDKEREIPLLSDLVDEIALYREAVELYFGTVPEAAATSLLVTATGRPLYPVYVDRAVKEELGGDPLITGRKSPHSLRHTLATSLLDDGADLNSIKELLGHSSLAATQVYTHNSIERLRSVYENAHPRAKEK